MDIVIDLQQIKSIGVVSNLDLQYKDDTKFDMQGTNMVNNIDLSN